MTNYDAQEVATLLGDMTADEKAEVLAIIGADAKANVWRPLPGPQAMAVDSAADVVGFGGSAGGGKSDCAVGLALTRHARVVIFRREKAQLEGVIQRMSELIGGTDGYNSQKGIWQVPVGTQPLVEFGGLNNPGDESRFQGRPHDLIVYDEATEMLEAQVRFTMGWVRSKDPKQRCRVLMTFNPPTTTEGRWVVSFFAPWLDVKHPNPARPGELRWFTTIKGKDRELPSGEPFVLVNGEPVYTFDKTQYAAEQIIRPKSRTFIPARLTDNPYYVATGYMDQLQALPEPLRSQMLLGDFSAGVQDDPFQVCPTAWVEAAMARWTKPPKLTEMLATGVDVARGGKDSTVIARRHVDHWYDEPIVYAGSETPNGQEAAARVIAATRDSAPSAVDAIGVGAAVYDFLIYARQQSMGVVVSEAATAKDKTGLLEFSNVRTQLWWQFRELLNPDSNSGICLPPDPRLKADLCAPTWRVVGRVIAVESRENIVKRIGRSPDFASAYILAAMEHPKRGSLDTHGAVKDYDPLSMAVAAYTQRQEHDPYAGFRR